MTGHAIACVASVFIKPVFPGKPTETFAMQASHAMATINYSITKHIILKHSPLS